MTNLVPIQERAPRRPVTAAVSAAVSTAAVTAAPRPSVFAVRLGLSGIVASALFMVQLTVVAWDRMSVLDTTMSDYVFVPGVGWMFGAAVLCMCVAGIGAAAGLAAIRLLDGTLLRALLGLAVLGSLLAALFPTDLGESLSVSAQIHRYAAGVVFFCVPIAAVLVARQLTQVGYLGRDRRLLYGSALVTAVVLALFMTSHLGLMPEALRDLNGLFQRMLFVLELALLGQIVLLPLRFRLRAGHQPRGSGVPSAKPDADWMPTTARS